MKYLSLILALISISASGDALLHFKGKLRSFDKDEVAIEQGHKIYHIKRSALLELKDKKLSPGKELALDVNPEDVIKTEDKK